MGLEGFGQDGFWGDGLGSRARASRLGASERTVSITFVWGRDGMMEVGIELDQYGTRSFVSTTSQGFIDSFGMARCFRMKLTNGFLAMMIIATI